MKTKTKKLLSVCIVLSLVIITSCNKEEDKYEDKFAPDISLSAPSTGTSIALGDTIDFKCDFSDNEALGSYTIDIAGTESQSWTYSKTANFEAGLKEASIELEILAPAEDDKANAGAFEITITCLDVAGNEVSEAIAISFRLPEEEEPIYTDNFEASIDFMKDDYSGTIWDGYLINGGVDTTKDATLVQLNTTANPGALTFETTLGHWEGRTDDGGFLYRNVAADTDFEVQMQIVGGNYTSFDGTVIDYMQSGLMIRPEGSSDYFVIVQGFDRPEWNVILGMSDNALGEETEIWDTDNVTSLADTPWLKLVRMDSTITGYKSADGINWVKIGSIERPELLGVNLQVGITHATFTENAGVVIVDNFTLKEYL